jgi:predicted DNA-binding protein (MmcQ/YjbR family)
MTINNVRQPALSLSGTSESRPFAPDRVVFKSAATNKVFAILSGHEFQEEHVTVKADTGDVISLKHQYDPSDRRTSRIKSIGLMWC